MLKRSLASKLPLHCQHLDFLCRSAWEEGRIGKLYLNLPATSSHILFSHLDRSWTMSGGQTVVQWRRPANQQHYRLPPGKTKSLFSICRCRSGHNVPGSTSHAGLKWLSLPHRSASITSLRTQLTPPAKCSITVSQAIAETIAVT